MKVDAIFCGVGWVVSSRWYGAVRDERTLFGFHDGKGFSSVSVEASRCYYCFEKY